MDNKAIDLTILIDKYTENIDKIKGTTEYEILENFLASANTDEIRGWIQKNFNVSSIKCVKKALEYREQGNVAFKTNNVDLSLNLYTKSLIYSPEDSEEYILALGNRSAALFFLKKYQSCMEDVELCFLLGYPENLKYKLYIRLINCLVQLNLIEKANEFFEIYLKYLEINSAEFTTEHLASLKQDALKINDNILNKNKMATPETDIIIKPVKFQDGGNSNFSSASSSIALKFNETKGRFVVAENDIKSGEPLFIEKSFACVPIFEEDDEHNKKFCYHCFKETFRPIPCRNCEEIFCSLECKKNSWDTYHNFECLGSCGQVWKKIGVNFLALRLLLLGFNTGGLFNTSEDVQSNLDVFKEDDSYRKVCCLVSNVEKMGPETVLPHLVSSLAITLYLKEKTNFYSSLKSKFEEHKSKSDETITKIIASRLLKHILQVICNASTIEAVKDNFYETFNSVDQLMDSAIFVNGVGIYPSVSMMNHSCDPNITNYFMGDLIIVKSNRDITKGEEIFNSYGYDCRKQITEDRKTNLKSQYFFECNCTGCTYPTKPEIYHEGLLCQECCGCSLTISDNMYKCTECCHEFNATNHFEYIKKAENLHEKYETSSNVAFLEKCMLYRQKVFYKYNYSIYTANLDLQTYYGNTGCFEEWWSHTEKSLDMDKHILGMNSLRYGLNLRLSLIILLRYLSKFSRSNVQLQDISETTFLSLTTKANEMFDQCKNIFKLFYPEDKLKYEVIDDLFQKVTVFTTFLLHENLFNDHIGANFEEKLNDFVANN